MKRHIRDRVARVVSVAALLWSMIAPLLAVETVCAIMPRVTHTVSGCRGLISRITHIGAPPPIVGDWAGRIDVPGAPLEIGIHVSEGDRGLWGTMDIPTQQVSALPLGEVRLDGSAVSFTLPGVPGDAAFRGALAGSEDAATIRGDWIQNGRRFPTSLSHGIVKPAARPQQPRPPFPYRSEDVTYRSATFQRPAR